ncbi:MAG TPA: hypothetical protein VKA38_16300 [Draconibacterium sp.]|nr:hypothetical protein [Draconibacterium sp.]
MSAGALKYDKVRLLNIEDNSVMHEEFILKGSDTVHDVSVGPESVIYMVLNNFSI